MVMNTNVEKFVRFCESDFGKRVLEKEAPKSNQEIRQE